MLGKIVFLTCIAVGATPAFAGCDPQAFMKPNIEITTISSALNWSNLNSISREKFEELKKDGHLWLSLPKVPLITKIDYDDFKRITQAETINQSQKLTLVETQTIYRSSLSAEASNNYIACLQNEVGSLDITVPPTALNNPEFFVKLSWFGPRTNLVGKFDNIGDHHFQIIGGEIQGEASYDKIESIGNGKSLHVKVRRDLDKPFGFSASVDGFSSEIGLPAKENAPDLTFKVARSEKKSAYADGNGPQHNGFCLSADDNQILLPSTAHFVEEQYPGNGKVWTASNGTSNEKQICATVNAEMYGGKHIRGNARIFSQIEALSIIISK